MGLEKTLDDGIGWAVRQVKQQRTILLALLAVVAAVFHSALLAFARGQVAQLSAAFSSGLSAEQLATGLATGVVSGLGPPGLTIAVALPVVAQLASVLGHSCSGPTLGLALAVNAVMTVPDLIVWQAVFARAGSVLLPGGRYVRPFVAGSIPWLLASPILFVAVHTAAVTAASSLLN